MFNTNLNFYPIMLFLSLIANIIVVMIISKRYNFTKQEVLCFLVYENIGIIGGAKILSFFLNYKRLNGHFNFSSLGLSAYGAVIGASIMLLLFSIQLRKPLTDILYIFMPPLSLMYGIGKIGCFLEGCCYGIEYQGFGNVIYNYSSSAPKNVPLFPIQFIETLFFIGIFGYIIIKLKKNQFNIMMIKIYFILCCLTKFILDFFRASHVNKILSLNQLISLVFIIGSLFIKTKE